MSLSTDILERANVLLTILFYVLLTEISAPLLAQVFSSFDTADSLEGWHAVGDGVSYLESGTGNPDNCMRIDDDATGNIIYAIAPLKFVGNWSVSTPTDSLTADIFLHRLSGSPTGPSWIFRISGPGGKAIALVGTSYQPVQDSWTHYAVSLDSTQWTIREGTWSSLLPHITLLEMMAEFINGDEYVRFDNIGLSFTPLITPVLPPIYSTFDNQSFEGWYFVNTGGASIQTSGGNPSGYIRITDITGVSQAIAPPAYLGDWSQLTGQATIQFDLKIISKSGSFLINHDLLRISGPGGVATVPYDSSILRADGRWKSFSFLIDPSVWTVISGDWNSLMANVTELLMFPEFYNNTETIGLDNFRLSNDPPVAQFSQDRTFLFPGDAVQFTDLSLFAPFAWNWSFGDGNTSSLEDPIYYYEEPGTYSVELKVTNFFGSDSLTKTNLIRVASISDSILYFDDFNDNSIHPAWQFRNGTWVETEGQMIQTSNYYGTGTVNGAFAIVGSKYWDDYTISVDLSSQDNDWIGLVFRYQDPQNFYAFTWQSEGSARFIRKIVNGTESVLVSDTTGYLSGIWYHVDLVTEDSLFKLYIDNTQIFEVIDTTFATGKAGLYCWANQNSYWDNFSVSQTNYVPIAPRPNPTELAQSFILWQNYPNPFNPNTTIDYYLPRRADVKLTIFNLLGEVITVHEQKSLSAGKYSYQWEARQQASGIYFYELQVGQQKETRKMILMK